MTEATLSTGRPLEKLRLTASSTNTESRSRSENSISSQQLSWRAELPRSSRRTLDFDIETVAAGFGDPQFVPNRTTCWAYRWIGEDEVHVDHLAVADFYDKEARREFLRPLLAEIAKADVCTGHNLKRFDLLVLMSECLLLRLPLLEPVLVQDTMTLPRSKGFRKGQDNMSHALGVIAEKKALTWAEWEEEYSRVGLPGIMERCASDVDMHVEMRAAMKSAGWLAAPKLWRP